MSRTPLKDRRLPAYTRGEDIANMVTHIIGGALGAIVLVLAVLIAARHGDMWGVVGSCIRSPASTTGCAPVWEKRCCR